MSKLVLPARAFLEGVSPEVKAAIDNLLHVLGRYDKVKSEYDMIFYATVQQYMVVSHETYVRGIELKPEDVISDMPEDELKKMEELSKQLDTSKESFVKAMMDPDIRDEFVKRVQEGSDIGKMQQYMKEKEEQFKEEGVETEHLGAVDDIGNEHSSP